MAGASVWQLHRGPEGFSQSQGKGGVEKHKERKPRTSWACPSYISPTVGPYGAFFECVSCDCCEK